MSKPKEVVTFAFRHPETGEVNEKQCRFYDKAMMAIARLNPLRYLFYGGAIRGGKTFVCLFILVKLAQLFPKSRWHIFRSDFPELEDTTIPSMEKLIGTEGKDFVWKKRASNYHILFKNGSKIFFKSENLLKDPELKWMLGLETNGIFLEQMEGLSEKLFSRAVERVGSWYIKNMPPPLILGTFNPTDTWVKKKIYDAWRSNELPADWYFEQALPDDNPWVTEDQWANWDNLDPISRAQLIEGIWRFLKDAKLFAYSFDRKKSVVDVNTPEGKEYMTARKGLPVYTIWDFNVDPITCIVAQRDGMKWCKILAEYRLRNSDIFELTERVYNDWGDYFLVATGDASGRQRSALTRGNRTFVKTIQARLHLSPRQMQFPMSNPSVRNTRVLMNSLFFRHPEFKISSDCIYTIEDLETVKVNEKGEIDKKKDATKSHFLDNCFDGDTMIDTMAERVKIKDVKIGDFVMTRKGFRRVFNHWSSLGEVYEYEFSDGSKIRATKDHKFYTSFGWMPLDTLYSCKIAAWKESFTMEELTACTQEANIYKQAGRRAMNGGFIDKFGLTTMAQFQKDMPFTTRTRMFLTTIFQTLKFLKEVFTNYITSKSGSNRTRNIFINLPQLEGSLQRHGMAARKVASGTVITERSTVSEHSFLNKELVNIAERNTQHTITDHHSVPIIVNQGKDESNGKTLKNGNASVVKKHFQLIDIQIQKTVPKNAQPYCVKRTRIGVQQVFDISVEGEPEFFANGFLVHNCRYLMWNYFRRFIGSFKS